MNKPISTGIFALCSLFALIFFSACKSTSLASLQIQADVDLPAGTPLTISLPAGQSCCEGLEIKTVGGESAGALQIAGDQQAIFLLETDLPAGTLRQFEIRQASADSKPEGPRIKEVPTGLEVMAGEREIFTYNTATLMPPAGQPDYYKRSGFIHPFYSPGGKVLTDGFPVGHTHQHGIFFAWVNTTYRGDFTDFWNQQNETGTVAFRELSATESGPVFSEIESVHDFLSLKHGPVLEESWTVRVYRLPNYNIIDLTSRQKIIGSDTLFINKYHYGGMGTRLSAEWNRSDSSHYTNPMQIMTSQGITNRDSANHTRPNWTAVFGRIAGDTAGMAIFDHPSNFRFPQPVRVHPEMPYFVLTPSVEAAFMLVPGQEYSATYRILSFDGEPDVEALEAMWRAYGTAVRIEWMQ